MLGVVVVGSVFFLLVLHGFAKMLVQANLISRYILGIHCRYLSKSATTQNLSEPTHVKCIPVYCLSLCLLLPRWGWAGQTSRGPRATSRYDTVCPRCVTVFAGANSRVKHAVPLGPTLSFRDACALLPTLCHCILLFESPKIFDKIIQY